MTTFGGGTFGSNVVTFDGRTIAPIDISYLQGHYDDVQVTAVRADIAVTGRHSSSIAAGSSHKPSLNRNANHKTSIPRTGVHQPSISKTGSP